MPRVIIHTMLPISQILDSNFSNDLFRFTLGQFASTFRVSDISNEAQTVPTVLHISPEISNNGLHRNMSTLDGNDEPFTVSGLPALQEGTINLR